MLSDLLGLIRCDHLVFEGHDSSHQVDWFGQAEPVVDGDSDSPFWEHYWDSLPCSYPDLTGDLRRVTTISDFYSARQWHSTGMYCDCFREVEHEIMVCLPLTRVDRRARADPATDPPPRARPGFLRARPRAAHRATPAPAPSPPRRRTPPPPAPPAHRPAAGTLQLVAAGHTNAQIARRLGISEGTVRTHLGNIYRLLQVSSRTAAVTRALTDRTG